MAMATLSVLPLLIAFLFAQKQFIRGLALTGQTG
jgi:multiple sugar transport system permease protein